MVVVVGWGGGRGGSKHFFSVTLYNFQKSGGFKIPVGGMCNLYRA